MDNGETQRLAACGSCRHAPLAYRLERGYRALFFLWGVPMKGRSPLCCMGQTCERLSRADGRMPLCLDHAAIGGPTGWRYRKSSWHTGLGPGDCLWRPPARMQACVRSATHKRKAARPATHDALGSPHLVVCASRQFCCRSRILYLFFLFSLFEQ